MCSEDRELRKEGFRAYAGSCFRRLNASSLFLEGVAQALNKALSAEGGGGKVLSWRRMKFLLWR